MMYQLYEEGTMWQCNREDHRRNGCPRSCRIRPRVVALDDDAPRKLVVEKLDPSTIRGWGDGTTGHITHRGDAWIEHIGMRTQSRERAVAWIARRLSDRYEADREAEDLVDDAEIAFQNSSGCVNDE